jgi:GDP-mannose 6-dehydrogenase
MKIAIFGLGYVGLTAAGCLCHQGHSVLGIDVNPGKVAQLKAGLSPISEPGLGDLIATGVKEGRLDATLTLDERFDACELAIVCVGTPSAADGSHNMGFITEVSRQIAAAVGASRTTSLTIAYRSTIKPGSIETLIAPIFGEALGERSHLVELVYNPEFLRESVAVKDFFAPPKIVVGTADGKPSARMVELNAGIVAPMFHVGYREAEFTKFADNSFHALKVSFANELGRVCLQLGVSAKTMHEIFISDTKLNISPYYLRPGGAFGGSCLPKDVRALHQMSLSTGADTRLIDNLIASNEAHKEFIFKRCVKGLKPAGRILMLGLAFKADTDDLRESPNVDLAKRILDGGFVLSIFDPTLDPGAIVGQNLGFASAALPNLAAMMVDRAGAEAGGFDLVIDSSGRRGDLALKPSPYIDINTLD